MHEFSPLYTRVVSSHASDVKRKPLGSDESDTLVVNGIVRYVLYVSYKQKYLIIYFQMALGERGPTEKSRRRNGRGQHNVSRLGRQLCTMQQNPLLFLQNQQHKKMLTPKMKKIALLLAWIRHRLCTFDIRQDALFAARTLKGFSLPDHLDSPHSSSSPRANS